MVFSSDHRQKPKEEEQGKQIWYFQWNTLLAFSYFHIMEFLNLMLFVNVITCYEFLCRVLAHSHSEGMWLSSHSAPVMISLGVSTAVQGITLISFKTSSFYLHLLTPHSAVARNNEPWQRTGIPVQSSYNSYFIYHLNHFFPSLESHSLLKTLRAMRAPTRNCGTDRTPMPEDVSSPHSESYAQGIYPEVFCMK